MPHVPALDGLRGGGRRRAALPRRPPDRRLPRRRPLLRALRLPDHVAAARRVDATGRRRARRRSGPAGPGACCRRSACSSSASRSTPWLFAKPDELAAIRGDAFATIGYVANWRAIFTSHDYWALFRSPSPLDHTWSLAIEEQFYLVWPLVFVGLLAWWKHACAEGRARHVVGSRSCRPSLMIRRSSTRPTRPACTTAPTPAPRVDPPRRRPRRVARRPRAGARRRVARIALEAGRRSPASSCSRSRGRGSTASRHALPRRLPRLRSRGRSRSSPPRCTPKPALISRVLSFRPLCPLGLISYGVYLWHWPIDIVLDPIRTGTRRLAALRRPGGRDPGDRDRVVPLPRDAHPSGCVLHASMARPHARHRRRARARDDRRHRTGRAGPARDDELPRERRYRRAGAHRRRLRAPHHRSGTPGPGVRRHRRRHQRLPAPPRRDPLPAADA